jgi:hypothetical protein
MKFWNMNLHVFSTIVSTSLSHTVRKKRHEPLLRQWRRAYAVAAFTDNPRVHKDITPQTYLPIYTQIYVFMYKYASFRE